MKKIITLFTMLTFLTLAANAQLTRSNSQNFSKERSISTPAEVTTGYEYRSLPKGSYLKSGALDPNYGDTVGFTWYDLQTNSGMGNRITIDASGNMQVVWTKAQDTIRDPGNANRGVGYNYYDASTMTWNPGDSNLTNYGIAEKRVGWPSIGNSGSGAEIVYAHTSRIYSNATRGATNWTAVDLTSNLTGGNLFYHAAAEGNSTYVLYDAGETYLFGRSDDGGVTWPIADFAIDSSLNAAAPGGAPEAYDIDAKGDSVAVVSGGFAFYAGAVPQDVVLYVSGDRGATWARTVIHEYDTINGELDSAGGYNLALPHADVRVTIGQDGKIHVGGSVVYMQTVAGTLDPNTVFPLERGIWYWNTDMTAGIDINDPADYSAHVLVDSIPDASTMGSYPDDLDNAGYYVGGLFGHANITTSPNGDVYIVFDGVCAGSDNNPFDGRWRRDLFAMASNDGGMNWTTAKNLGLVSNQFDLTDGTVGEEVFPNAPKRVNGDIPVLFQYDSWAGNTLQDDFPILEENKMAVYMIDPSLLNGIQSEIAQSSVNIFPNPASSNVTLSFEAKNSGETVVTISNMIGQTVKIQNADIISGSNNVTMDLTSLNEGIYLVSIGSGSNKITQKLVIE